MLPNQEPETVLHVEGLTKNFGVPVLQELNLRVERGESVAL